MAKFNTIPNIRQVVKLKFTRFLFHSSITFFTCLAYVLRTFNTAISTRFLWIIFQLVTILSYFSQIFSNKYFCSKTKWHELIWHEPFLTWAFSDMSRFGHFQPFLSQLTVNICGKIQLLTVLEHQGIFFIIGIKKFTDVKNRALAK